MLSIHQIVDTYIILFSLLSAFLCRIIHTTSTVITVTVISKNIPTVIDIIIIKSSEIEFPVDATGVTESAVTKVHT